MLSGARVLWVVSVVILSPLYLQIAPNKGKTPSLFEAETRGHQQVLLHLPLR